MQIKKKGRSRKIACSSRKNACSSRRNACRSRRNARRRSTRRKTGGANIGYIAPPPPPQLRVEQPDGPDFSVTDHSDYDVVYNNIITHGSNRYRTQIEDGSYTIVNGEYGYRILPTIVFNAESDALRDRLAALRADYYQDYQDNQDNQYNQELPPPPQT